MIASTRTYALELVRRRNGTKFCGVSVPPPDVTPSSSTFRAEFCETALAMEAPIRSGHTFIDRLTERPSKQRAVWLKTWAHKQLARQPH